jgi:hypothetical protein
MMPEPREGQAGRKRSIESLRALIDSPPADDYDRLALDVYDHLALVVAPEVYDSLGDASFDWLADSALAAEPSESAEKYWIVLSSIGWFSDGFSPAFMERASSLALSEAVPLRGRLACLDGTLRWEVYYRPEIVYERMEQLANHVIRQSGPLGRDRIAQGSARVALSRLKKRSSTLADLASGRLVVPDAVLTRATDTSTETGVRFADLGLGPEDFSVLRMVIALAIVWGVKGIRSRDMSRNSHLFTLRAKDRFHRDALNVHWFREGTRQVVHHLEFFDEVKKKGTLDHDF